MEIICFFAGMAFFYLKSRYPLYLLGIILCFRPKISLIFWFLAAIVYCTLHEWIISDSGMPKTTLIKQANLEGYIASIPAQTPHKTQFLFSVTRLDQRPVQTTALLSCYEHCPILHSGQYWRLQAKLKKPINLANPGGFDYVRWAHSRHIQWVGNVKHTAFTLGHVDTSGLTTTQRNKTKRIKQTPLISPQTKPYLLTRLREKLSNRLNEINPDEETLGVFESLTIGLTNHVSKSQWDLFRKTGTTHLIDISGEHIAIVAGCTYWLLKWLWKHLGYVCLRYPAPKIASFGAILVTGAYTLLAGFSVPTQRALIMCVFMLSGQLFKQRFGIWQAWRYALFTVLLVEPHSVLMLGFYFSFIAVAILILVNRRFNYTGIRRMLSLQLACLLGLMPLTLYWFSYGSVNGLIANLVAIPWVGFLIVPIALIIALLSPWYVIPYSIPILQWTIHCLLICLGWIDAVINLHIDYTFTDALPPMALMFVMALLLYAPIPTLWPATLVITIASLFPHYEKVIPGDARIDVLDVGQGLSVIINTAEHTLIYDTGMKFYQGGDIATSAIMPYLRTLGLKKINTIVISHPDLDHRGGLESLEQRYPVDELIVNDPTFYQRGVSCHHYPAWEWDGVSFQFFPIQTTFKSKNNNSCILQVKNRSGQVLLSGDIEAQAERYLAETYGNQLASTVMIIPHHGSKTSSSMPYIERIAPHYAIASYGFDNRYHFPHQQAMQAYQNAHIPIYDTLSCGMIRFYLNQAQRTPDCYRHD